MKISIFQHKYTTNNIKDQIRLNITNYLINNGNKNIKKT